MARRCAIAYSEDLRRRAIDLIENGYSMSKVSRLLNISRPTLYRWRNKFEQTGSITPEPNIPPPEPSKIKDWEKFQEFVDKNGDKTQIEMAKLWGGVSNHTISRGLKKLGYSRKKKLTVIKNVANKLEKSLEKK